MSIYDALTNLNTLIRITGTSSETTGGKEHVYISLTNCPVQFTVQRAIIIASGAGIADCGLSIYEGIATATEILNPAFFDFTLDTATYSAVVSIESVVLSPYHNGDIQISIHSQTGNIPAGLTFTVTLEVMANSISNIDYVDNATYKKDDSLKVLRWDSVSLQTVDLTNAVRQMMIIDDTTSVVPIALNHANDYLYIGSEQQNTVYEVVIDDASRQSTDSVCVWEFYNGTSWGDATPILDSTTSNQSTNTSLEYSGILEFNPTIWNTAVLTQLTAAIAGGSQTGDPTNTMINTIQAGTSYPIAFTYSPSRYWIRLSITSGGTFPIKIYALHPLNKS